MMLDLTRAFAGKQESLDSRLDLSGLELDGVKPFCAPIEIHADLHGLSGSAELTLTVRYTVSKPCDRCGALTQRAYDRQFTHLVVRELADQADDDGDYVVAEDDRLDLDELVREDILLDLPTKYLCREDCKGLCPTCGKDLNQGPCGCARQEIDPRLAALAGLLED